MSNLQTFIMTLFEITAFMIMLSSFNKGKEKLLLKNIAITLLISASVTWTSNINIKFMAIFNYILLLIVLYIFYNFNLTILELVSQFCLTTVLLMIIQLFLTLFLEIINRGHLIYTFENGLILNMISLILSVIVYFILPIEELYKKYILNTDISKFLILKSIIYIVCLKLLWEYDKKFILTNVLLLILLFLVSSLINLLFFRHTVKLKEEKKTIEAHNRYTPIFENLVHDAKRKQHEFKNHLNTIYGICSVTDERLLKIKIKEYIKSLNDSLKDIDKIINANNEIVAAVIYSSLCEAKNKNIQFEYLINNEFNQVNLKEYELTEILSNLLNNAFEAVCDLNIEEKIVYAKIGTERNKNFIEVGNKGIAIKTENIESIFKRGFTTKAKTTRGYGLYNIQKIVENYKGEIQLSFENGYTIFKILF